MLHCSYRVHGVSTSRLWRQRTQILTTSWWMHFIDSVAFLLCQRLSMKRCYKSKPRLLHLDFCKPLSWLWVISYWNLMKFVEMHDVACNINCHLRCDLGSLWRTPRAQKWPSLAKRKGQRFSLQQVMIRSGSQVVRQEAVRHSFFVNLSFFRHFSLLGNVSFFFPATSRPEF